jgi:hypothetical protein
MSERRVIPENHPHQLCVEGTDDVHSIIHFIARHGFDWSKPPPTDLPYVKSSDSDEAVLRALSPGLKTWHRFGIVVDADDNPVKRWGEIRKITASLDVSLPSQPSTEGDIVPGITPDRRFGVWMMPDNQTSGRLEDFLRTLIPAEDKIWPHAQTSTEQAQALGAPFKPVHLGKAQFRTWLAWQEQPGLPPGKAIHRKLLSEDSPVALRFLGWFRRLFLEP